MGRAGDGVALVVDNRHDKLALLLRTKDVLRSVTEKPIGVIINRLSHRKRNPYYTAAVIPDVNADKEVIAQTHASNGHNGNGNSNDQKPEQVMATPIAPMAIAEQSTGSSTPK